MVNYLANKNILLGVTGSISAYKSADLVRRLRDQGANVRVVMTENAEHFITPLTMQAVSGNPVHTELFDIKAEAAMGHIELARWADIVLVAPASADFIARLSQGKADDLLSSIWLATNAKKSLAPAMNQGMWMNPLTQENISLLQKTGVKILGPTYGDQACGDVGFGRLLDPIEIVKMINEWYMSGPLSLQKVLITAGPTHEAIDPVRFMTNGSSGKMGHALCEAARDLGAEVTLISGPVNLRPPSGVNFLSVKSAIEMYEAVMAIVSAYDIFIAVAAVSDYRCQTIAQQKIAKTEDVIQLTLLKNPDIVDAVSRSNKKPFIVGFAAETHDVILHAQKKKARKNMDMIIANQIDKNVGMGTDDNEVTVIGRNSEISLPRMTKHKLAKRLMELIVDEYKMDEDH
jgi:phosphopantothenoylcysteine decarboxylase/phosphopantothenate--cysteine ligase